jgi:hypothetical protein
MKLSFSFDIEGKHFRGAEKFLPALQCFQNSFLPKPNRIEITDKKGKNVVDYLDKEILKALEIQKYVVYLCIDEIDTEIMLIHGRDEAGIGFSFSEEYVKQINKKDLIELFINISRLVNPTFSFCSLESKYVEILEKNRDIFNRTFYAKGLRWLNFFGPEEEERQGGKTIEQNPYATRIERFPEGLFIQVGNTPFDCLTPDGELQLVNATKAMPPLK